MVRHCVSFLVSRVHTDARRPAHVRERSGRRHKARSGILGVNSRLDSVSCARALQRPTLPKRHAQLLLDEVHAADHLGDWVLDL